MGSVAIGFIGGTTASAEVNGAFSFDDPSFRIYDSEIARYFDRSPGKHFKKGIVILPCFSLFFKSYFPVCAVTIGQAF